ncbi:MAG: BamA/TamA family outer membrane protein [Ignavibacterium sp.]|nr:BamA/TamA family outer membrane protein [Ignavibacterium sp.]
MIKKSINITKLKILFFVLPILYISNCYSQSKKFELIDIKFFGNNSFSQAELEKQLESKKTPWWLWKFLKSFTPLGSEKKFFDSLNIPIDVKALMDFYLTNGFFSVNVKSKVELDTLKEKAVLIFEIEEGKPSVFGDLTIVGLNKLNSDERQSVDKRFSNISNNKPFRQSEIEKSISETLRFLTNNGYLFATLDSAVVIKDTFHLKADVSIYFNTGDKYYVDGIKIQKSGAGASELSNDLIKEIITLNSGDIYDQSRLERSEIRLLRTGLFNSVSINPLIREVENNLVPIEIVAQVSTFNEISPELKVDNEFNAFNTGLGINLIRKNFLGSARKLNISGSFRFIDIINFDFKNIFSSKSKFDSTYQGVMDLEVGIEQPYLFGRPILTITKAYYRSSKFKTDSERLVGANQSFDFEMPEYTFITLMKPQFSLELSDFDYKFPSIELEFQAKSLTPALGIELGSYKTDNFLFPISGYNLYIYPEIFQAKTDVNIISIDSSSSLSQIGWFWKVQTSFSNFYKVSRDGNGALAIKIKSGYIQSFSGNYDLIPPNRTFFSGGSNSIRGWRVRELLPEDKVEYFGISSQRDKTPRGGTFLLEGSFEFRRKFLEDFGFSAFLDYGNVWNGYKKINLTQFAVAMGLGLRYYSPIAPFRVDFGLKFYNPSDKKLIFEKRFLQNIEFHFGIGEAF